MAQYGFAKVVKYIDSLLAVPEMATKKLDNLSKPKDEDGIEELLKELGE